MLPTCFRISENAEKIPHISNAFHFEIDVDY